MKALRWVGFRLRLHKRGEEEAAFVVNAVWLAWRLAAALGVGASVASAAIVATSGGSAGQHISPKGVALIERNEGVRYHPYQDPSGIAACTVGAGHVLSWTFCTPAQLASTYTAAQVADLLRADARKAESCLPATTQPAFDALVDLTLNAGCGSILWHPAPYYRTVYSLVAAGQLTMAAAEIRNTAVTAGGRLLAGLVARRDREAILMVTGYYGAGIGYYVTPRPPRAGYWCRWYRYGWSTCVG